MNVTHLPVVWAVFLLTNVTVLARNIQQKIISMNATGTDSNATKKKMVPSQSKNAVTDAPKLLMANATLKQKNVMNAKEVLMIQVVCTQWTIAKQFKLEDNAKRHHLKESTEA